MRFKRAIMMGGVGVVVVATYGSVYAHYYQVGGKWLYHSLGTELILKSVPNPDSNPALAIWTANISEYEFVCLNPANNTASAQVMVRSAIVSTAQDVSEGEFDKKKGTVALDALLDTDFLANSEDCVNPNWNAQPDTVLVTEFTAVSDVYVCSKDDKKTPEDETCVTTVLETRTNYDCHIPAGYTALSPPPPGTAYECLATEEHF